MAKTLATNDSVWTAVFRRIVRQVTTDAQVRRVFGDRVKSWEGTALDAQELKPERGRPMLRLTPSPRAVEWFSPDSQKGWLDVVVEVAVNTFCIDDPIDAWDLVVQALRPGAVDSQGGALRQDLAGLGAETGEIVFADPVIDRAVGTESTGVMVAVGRFTLAVLREIS